MIFPTHYALKTGDFWDKAGIVYSWCMFLAGI